MAFLSIIRRWHKREHVPIRESSGRLGVSRNTIRIYLWSEAIETKFRLPNRPSKLDPYAEKPSGEPSRPHHAGRKAFWVGTGYGGGNIWRQSCRKSCDVVFCQH